MSLFRPEWKAARGFAGGLPVTRRGWKGEAVPGCCWRPLVMQRKEDSGEENKGVTGEELIMEAKRFADGDGGVAA